MTKIIDLASYREKVFVSDELSSLLRSKGADDELVQFAVQRQKELWQRHETLGKYGFEISLEAAMSNTNRETLVSQIQSGVEQVKSKLLSENYQLMAELLLAEIKLFQYQRLDK